MLRYSCVAGDPRPRNTRMPKCPLNRIPIILLLGLLARPPRKPPRSPPQIHSTPRRTPSPNPTAPAGFCGRNVGIRRPGMETPPSSWHTASRMGATDLLAYKVRSRSKDLGYRVRDGRHPFSFWSYPPHSASDSKQCIQNILEDVVTADTY